MLGKSRRLASPIPKKPHPGPWPITIEVGLIFRKNGSQDSSYLCAILKNAKGAIGLQSDRSVDQKDLRIVSHNLSDSGLHTSALNAGDEEALKGESGIKRFPCGHNFLERKGCHKQETVLVEIVQLVEYPNHLVSTLVRLDRLKELYEPRAELLFLGKACGFVFGRRIADGKLRFTVRLPAVGFMCLPRQMIECASQVMECVPGNEGEGDRCLASDFDAMDFISRLRVILDSESIRILVPECPHSRFEIVDVLVGPFDFRPDVD
jgi:hypothetical protein